MKMQLNKTAIGCILEAPTKRWNGSMMRDFLLYLEFLSPCEQTIDFSKDATFVVYNANKKIVLMKEGGIYNAKYKLYADSPVFLKYKFALYDNEWHSLLSGTSVSITIADETYDISNIIEQLNFKESEKNHAN